MAAAGHDRFIGSQTRPPPLTGTARASRPLFVQRRAGRPRSQGRVGGRSKGGEHGAVPLACSTGSPGIAMLIDGKWMRSAWIEPDGWSVGIIDQTKLPHAMRTMRLTALGDAVHAICAMQTRGAPLIGPVAAYGLFLSLRADPSDAAFEHAYGMLLATRPTAVNLKC